MKRNFKVIKQDKNLSNLSDADIDKLYSTYIEMDGKHQNFKGSKREYCSTVAGMIKDWLKAVVDKNGGFRDKNLTGGKGTRKGILEKKEPIEKAIQKASDKITDLRGRISAADTFITTTFKKKKDKITKANNPKISKTKKEIEDIQIKIPKAQTELTDLNTKISENKEKLKPIPNAMLKGAYNTIRVIKENRELFVKGDPRMMEKIFENSNLHDPNTYQVGRDKLKHRDAIYSEFAYRTPNNAAGIKEIIKDYNEQIKDFNKEIKDLEKDPRNFVTRTSTEIKKINSDISLLEKQLLIKQKALNDLDGSVKPLEVLLASQEENKDKALSELAVEKTKTEEEKAHYLKRIVGLEEFITTKEAEIKSVEEEEEKYSKEKDTDFIETLKKIEFGTRSDVKRKTPTSIASVRGVMHPDIEKYTFQKLVDEAYEYRRVIKFFLSGEPYPTGTPESHGVYVVRRFLKALPYKKLLEISPAGFIERQQFIADHGLTDRNGNAILWTEEVEESFRSESFVFWTLLAKDVKDKDVVVNNFELLGKIFSHVLYFAPVDFKTKYFTGDSKGVKSTSVQTNGFKYPRDPVVDLGKILSVLSEAATIKPSGEIEFNNPRIIFTFYRDNRVKDSDKKPIGRSKMLDYTQDKTTFSKLLPYELLLDYDLKTLLSGEGGKAIEKIIRDARTPGGKYLQHRDNLEKLKELVNVKYEARNPTTLFPKTDNPTAFTLRMSSSDPIGDKIRKDLKIVGYTEEIFQGDEPTIENYTKRYTESGGLEYNGSYISKFKFPGLFEEGAVVTEIEVQGDTDNEDLTIVGDDEPVRIEGYFREGETDTQRLTRIKDEEKKKEAEKNAAEIAAMKERSILSKEKKAAEEAAAVARKEELRKMREERDARLAKLAAEPKQPVIRKPIIKKSDHSESKGEEGPRGEFAAKPGEIGYVAEGKPSEGKGKPKSYIKKIIKYYQ